ncbi:MAG TPA: hypothetical protein VMI31_16975 [Fimbriimonadaceae bacterium]|nr:hypothetical protein [Fimbriimonadaceae bacterium]
MWTIDLCAPAIMAAALLAGSFVVIAPSSGVQAGSREKAVSSMPIPQVPGLGPVAPARCVKWDYVQHPVKVTGTGTAGWPCDPRWAFDGYPTDYTQPDVRNYWRVDQVPTPQKPAELVIDYGRPVAVTRFVHYFNRFRHPCAWKDVEILTSDDGKTWNVQEVFGSLRCDCPQVIGVDMPAAARFYKISIRSLADGAPGIQTCELETYYGATIGNSGGAHGALSFNVFSPDADLKGATLRLVAPKGSLRGDFESAPFDIPRGGASRPVLHLLPATPRDVRATVELRAGGFLIDSRPFVIQADEKPAPEAQKALHQTGDRVSQESADLKSEWTLRKEPGIGNPRHGEGVRMSIQPKEFTSPVTGTLTALADGKPIDLVPVGSDRFAALVPGGALSIRVGEKEGDAELSCQAVPDPGTTQDFLDLELRFAVDNPKTMFRPHIDWYTVEHGPNFPDLTNGHNSTTRMLCIQTASDDTFSMVPDTDNMTWGFGKNNEMVLQLQIPLAAQPPLGDVGWNSIWQAPQSFHILLPVRKGDWWDAYRHVVTDIFHFEQARQWAMPVTEMQMLNTRYVMRYDVWSEKWQTVRSFPWSDFFYNFYGSTYTIPTLYSWYLVTDDKQAQIKAEKVVDWLVSVQQTEGPAAGSWFSQYDVEGDPPQLTGRDQAWNRWVMPHSTATAAKTLLWYWNASGRQNAKVFAAAKRGCDWLLATQRPDGGWPYAFDLNGKPITDLADAGQIWCTWALWKMYEITGDARYREASERSAEFFKKTFMDVHRYMGYWEDVSGAEGKVNRSWEGYEPAIASIVFEEMGEKDLALEAAKDSAVWTWTRVISTRQYETCYGETTEQSLCGPSQAQSPMNGLGFERTYEMTGDPLWSDFAGATKSVNFCADPDQAYGMVATGGWDDPLTGVVGPPYDNVRPMVAPGNKPDEYGRLVWNEWCSAQFAWLSLEWLVREGNIRAPEYVKIDPDLYRGAVLGEAGRVKMPEEKCDVNGIEHHDINWVGYENDAKFVLLVMNHKEKLTVAIRPHEAHLDVYSRPPRILVGGGKSFRAAKVERQGEQYMVPIPAGQTALLIWDRIK